MVAVIDERPRGFDLAHSHTGAQRRQAGVADLPGFLLAWSFLLQLVPHHKARSTPTNLCAFNEHRTRTRDAVGPLTQCSDAGWHEFALNSARGRSLDVGASRFHRIKPKVMYEVTNAASKQKRLCFDGPSFNFVRCWDFTQGKVSPCLRLNPQGPHYGKYSRLSPSSVVSQGVGQGRSLGENIHSVQQAVYTNGVREALRAGGLFNQRWCFVLGFVLSRRRTRLFTGQPGGPVGIRNLGYHRRVPPFLCDRTN